MYDAAFFGWQADGSASSAAVVAPLLDELIAPDTVLDVGCGLGTWAARWPGSTGVDGEWVARNKLRIPPHRFVPHDLGTPLILGERFDMALCLEVAEHLDPKAGRVLVDTLCRHSDIIVFSAAVPEQGGVGHVNEQWPSYWAKLFARHGYQPYDMLRDWLWWDQRVEWWYRQNLIIFANTTGAAQLPLSNFQCGNRTLDLAHPALLMPELRRNLHATVCIPWRPTPSRMAAFRRVMEYWEMFGWPVVFADSETEVFSLAQARNAAVRKATTDVVVIADADTLIDPLNVLRAVAEPDGVCWPFTRYRILAGEYLDTPIAELASVPHVNTWDGEGVLGVGGCMVTTRKEYWRLGGQPSEFIGWGWEDTAFTAVVETLSKVKRLSGHAYAFEHNSHAEKYTGAKADSPGWDRDISRNEHLIEPYRNAKGRPWLMRQVLGLR